MSSVIPCTFSSSAPRRCHPARRRSSDVQCQDNYTRLVREQACVCVYFGIISKTVAKNARMPRVWIDNDVLDYRASVRVCDFIIRFVDKRLSIMLLLCRTHHIHVWFWFASTNMRSQSPWVQSPKYVAHGYTFIRVFPVRCS